MKDWEGSVTYIEYVAGTNKGQTKAGDVFNSAFGLGLDYTYGEGYTKYGVDSNYTGSAVVEPVETFVSGTTKIAFTPYVDGTIKFLDADGNELEATDVSVAEDGTVTATVTGTVKKIAYKYNNIIIPQAADKLPTVTARTKRIPLIAKARRIVINFAQIAQFQAQTEYGLDLNKALSEQATSRLQFEIDNEIIGMLLDAAKANPHLDTFSLVAPIGVSLQEHYASFVNTIDKADQTIYDITNRYNTTYMVAGSGIKKVLRFCPEWKANNSASVNGPYLAGTLGEIKVFISPALASNEYFFGVNGGDLMTSAAVYAPYLPIIPTQAIQFADGTTSQGFSTVYDAKVINPMLVVYGQIA